jgi:uncharacterized protein YhdP
MKKLLKLGLFCAATSLLLVIIGSLAVYHLLRVGEFRRFVITQIEQQTQLEVQLGQGEFDLGWIAGIGFQDLKLSDSGAAQPLLTAERITARIALLPLLQRKLIFYDVRLLKPSAQLVRENNGRIPLLDKLLTLPFLQQKSLEYEFDLRSIKIQQAQLQWIDRVPDGPPVSFRLRDLDAEIERLGGHRLREVIRDLLKIEKKPPSGAALRVALDGMLEKDSENSPLSLQGKLVLPHDTFELRNAWWSADLRFNDLPAKLLGEYGGGRVPLRPVSGRVAQQVHFEGRASERVQVSGDLEFKQLGLDAPELFAMPLNAGDGKASFAAEWTPRRLALSQLTIVANDVSVAIKGEIRSTSDDSRLALQLSASPMPIATVRRLLPTKLIASSEAESLIANIQEGEVHIKKAGIDASLAQIRRWIEFGIGGDIWLEAELRNVGIRLSNGERAMPLGGVQGQITLNNDLITLTDINGNYGNSRLNSLAGTYSLRERALNLQALADLDLAEFREQLLLGVFASQAKILTGIQELSGRAQAAVTLNRIREAPPEITGRLALANAQVRKDDFLLTQGQGDIIFTGTEIKAEKISAAISGSPIEIAFVVRDYALQDGVFDLSVNSTGLKSGIVTRLLLSSGSLNDPGIVRGSVRYQGSLTNKDKRSFTGILELVNVQLATSPLLQPIRALNGKINIDESGIDFKNLRGLLVGFPSAASGRWHYAERPQLVFDFTAPSLDITYLLTQLDAESSEFYANLQAQGRIAVANGKIRAIDFGDLKSDVTLDRRVWRLTNLTARAAGGAVQAKTSIDDRADSLSIRADSQVRGVPVQSFLRWFDMTTTEMSGTVNLTGSLETAGNDDAERKRNLNGAFNLKIEEGIIHRMRILVQILNLLDLSRWFTLQLPDLAKDGIRFRSIAGDFKVNKGVYYTQNLVVDSDDLRMTGTGRIDVTKDDIDFLVAVRPFAGIDTVINHIPLLGRGIAAIKNSFLVASFNIKGSIEEPTITPAPLGTLSEWFWGVLGIPKNAIGLGENLKRDDNKAAPQ